MKKMLLVNTILSGLLMLLIFTSGKSAVLENEVRFTHHFTKIGGISVLVPGSYRQYNEVGGYVVCECPKGMYFNCTKIVCDWPEFGCGCAN